MFWYEPDPSHYSHHGRHVDSCLSLICLCEQLQSARKKGMYEEVLLQIILRTLKAGLSSKTCTKVGISLNLLIMFLSMRLRRCLRIYSSQLCTILPMTCSIIGVPHHPSVRLALILWLLTSGASSEDFDRMSSFSLNNTVSLKQSHCAPRKYVFFLFKVTIHCRVSIPSLQRTHLPSRVPSARPSAVRPSHALAVAQRDGGNHLLPQPHHCARSLVGNCAGSPTQRSPHLLDHHPLPGMQE